MSLSGLLSLMVVSTHAVPHERLVSNGPLLLPKATRVVFHARNCVAIGIPLKPGYFWQSSANLLCFRQSKRGHLNMFRVDTSNGHEVPLTHLNALLAKTLDCNWMRSVTRTKPSHFFCQPFVENVALSPDGKRLLWLHNSRPGKAQWMVAALDGTQLQHWDARQFSELKTRACWSPDSQSCLVRAFADKGLFTQRYDVRTGQHSASSIPIPADWKTLADTFPTQFSGVLTTGQLLFMPTVSGEKIVTQVPLCALTLQGAIRRWKLRLPFSAQVEDLKLSPDGTRLALLLRYTSLVSATSSAQGIQRVTNRKAESVESVWTCSVEGGVLGTLNKVTVPVREGGLRYHSRGIYSPDAAQGKDGSNSSNQLTGLNWLPDANRLSFFYQDALWIVPTG